MTDDTPIGTHTFNDKGEKIQVIGEEEVNLTGKFFNIITEKHLNVFCKWHINFL
jgi:ribosomal protein L13